MTSFEKYTRFVMYTDLSSVIAVIISHHSGLTAGGVFSGLILLVYVTCSRTVSDSELSNSRVHNLNAHGAYHPCPRFQNY